MVRTPAMSSAGDFADEGARLDRIYRDKARAEIAIAESSGGRAPEVRASGDELAEVLLVKGEPGREDREAGHALAGPDGEAADKALDALGLSAARFAFCTRDEGLDDDRRSERIRTLVEAVDPSVVIALDMLAAADLSEALGIERPAAGATLTWHGRTILAVEGLEASLADEGLKRRVWRQFKALTCVGDPEM